jgi:cbb3-type cytochrome oxidase subunit 1
MALRAIGGTLLVTSFALFTYNIFATLIQRKPVSRPAIAAPVAAD